MVDKPLHATNYATEPCHDDPDPNHTVIWKTWDFITTHWPS